MTNEQAKSELMQIYMSLSEEKKKALDVAFKAMEQAQADGEYISRQAVQNYIAHFLSLYLQDNVREAVEAIDEVIGDMPSVDILQDHDGCKDCKHELKSDGEYPCSYCKQNYKDMWQKKQHWNHGVCDNCGYDWGKDAPIASVPNFCPNCGSPMEIER